MEILDMKCAEYGNKIVEEIGNASEKKQNRIHDYKGFRGSTRGWSLCLRSLYEI